MLLLSALACVALGRLSNRFCSDEFANVPHDPPLPSLTPYAFLALFACEVLRTYMVGSPVGILQVTESKPALNASMSAG